MSATNQASTPAGGTNPTATCWKFEVNGTGATRTLTVYKGTGTGWAVFTGWTSTQVMGAVTVASSALSATPHKIVEFRIDHIPLAINPTTWILVAGYDASNSGSGLQVWPTASSPNVPNDYGLLNSLFETVPEGIGVVLMAAMSSIAIIAGVGYHRKQAKAKLPN